jgi:hypothetical protein
MSSLAVPSDLAFNLQEALRWSGQTDAATEFVQLVSAGVPWSPARPRELIRWAERRRVCATSGERFLTVMLCGFADGKRLQRSWWVMRMLRETAADVANGKEAPLIVGEGCHAWTADDDLPRRGWMLDGLGIFAPPAIPSPATFGSPANGFMPALPPASPSSAPTSPAPERPLFPRGGWVTKRR